MVSAKKRTVSPIMIKFGTEIEIGPQYKYFAGASSEAASRTMIFSFMYPWFEAQLVTGCSFDSNDAKSRVGAGSIAEDCLGLESLVKRLTLRLTAPPA